MRFSFSCNCYGLGCQCLLPSGGEVGPEVYHDLRHKEILFRTQADVEIFKVEQVLQIVHVAYICVNLWWLLQTIT